MKRIIIIFILINILACNNKDKIVPSINGGQLLALVDRGSIKDFTELIKQSKFHVIDSFLGKSSGIEYVGYLAIDSSKTPNTLKVQIDKKLNVIYLSFETKNRGNFQLLKEDFMTAGFTVMKKEYGIEQFGKENNPIEIIMTGFEKTSKTFGIYLGRKIN